MLVPIQEIQGLPLEFAQNNAHKAFAIKRFDRKDNAGTGKSVHIEDFAQIFNVYPDKKYDYASYRNLAEVIWRETGEPGIIEFVRRLVFNILIGNGDMHLKNWSFIYPNGITPQLAPAYDFVSTIPYIDNDTLALSLEGTKAFSEVSLNTFSKFAIKSRLPEKLVLNTARETLDKFASIWQEVARGGKHGLEKNFIEAIKKHLKTLSLWQGKNK